MEKSFRMHKLPHPYRYSIVYHHNKLFLWMRLGGDDMLTSVVIFILLFHWDDYSSSRPVTITTLSVPTLDFSGLSTVELTTGS